MVIDPNGMVGIGTPTPDAKLQVVGGDIKVDANQNISIGDLNFHSVKDSHNYIDFNQSLFFRNTAAVNHMVIDPNGKVGIGTASPNSKLHVAEATAGHVALIENKTTSTGHGLLIKINKTDTDENNEFVTFHDGAGRAAGQISGFQFPDTFDPTPRKADETAIFPDFQFLFNVGKVNVGSNFSASTSAETVLNNSFSLFKTAITKNQTTFFNTFFDTSMDLKSLSIGKPDDLISNIGLKTGQTAIKIINGVSFTGGGWPTINADFSVSGGSFPSISLSKADIIHTFNRYGVSVQIPEIPMLVPKPINDLMAGGLPFLGTSTTTAATTYWEFHKWKLRNGYEDLFDTESAADFAMASLKMLAADLANDGGVTYESNGADYAEWLPKADTTVHFNIGEIVAVKDGKITKNTENAENIMIISSRPIVLGNIPPKGQEENYDKVGFMGQVATLVKGKVNVGDYIIPSGDNDGFAIGIAPENISIKDIPKIAGKAWSATKNHVYDFVNVAVGLSTGEMATIMQKQVDRMDALEARLQKIEAAIKIK